MASKGKRGKHLPGNLRARVSRAKLLSRRDFLKRTALTGAALGMATTGLRDRALAATSRLAVTTMPGPRWEGALRASAKAYEAKNPNVEIDILVSPYVEHYQRIGTSLTNSSSDFDLHLFDPVLIGNFYSKLQPLNELFDADSEWRDYYLNGVPYFYRGSWDWDEIPYAVVHDANCMMTWWRSDVFDKLGLKAPTSLEQILENTRVLNQAQPKSGFMTCAGLQNWFLGMTYTGMLRSFGGRWYENDEMDRFGRIDPEKGSGALLLDSAEALAAARMIKALSEVWNEGSLNALEFQNAEAFKNGIVHQQVMWSGFMTLQDPKENPKFHDVLVSADFPVGGTSHDPNHTGMKGGFGLAIPKASKNIELAFDFAKFTVGEENAENFIRGGGQPSNVSLLNSWGEQQQYQVFKSIALGIEHGHHQAQFPEGPKLFQIITQHIGDLVTGKIEPERACENMKRESEALFRRAGYI
jgi:ABC-type glycerol-3-phosphate transport system substrate-binding protein